MTRIENLPTYDAEHPAFAGHFPAHPIVPGVLLLDATLRHICVSHGLCASSCRVAATKFVSAVKPGEALQLRHTPDEQGGVRFSLHAGREARLAASGLIQCNAAQPTAPVDA